ncbi:MAG: hypothetical protein H0X49_12880 [Acidobacteria bacterium]|nr:hypothetical protein [Acidobacteriota bacterium]
MLKEMNEFDEAWARKLTEARRKAQAAGRADVAEYLTLKASNDLIRQTSVKWLLDSATEIVSIANRNGASIMMENENPHSFAFGNANLAGSRLSFRQGVRCITIEAGWTRTPNDGFMPGGALAASRISHFGMSKHNAELLLIRSEDAPKWFAAGTDGKRHFFDAENLHQHFRVFLGTI